MGAISDSWLAAGSALVGALLGALGAIGGGMLTLRGQRRQWMSDTRRAAYVEVLSEANKVQVLIARDSDNWHELPWDEWREALRSFNYSVERAQLLAGMVLFSQLEAWRLYAANVLSNWPGLNSASVGRSSWKRLPIEWQMYRNDLTTSAAEELGVGQGRLKSKRLATRKMCLFAILFAAIGAVRIPGVYSFNEHQVIAVVLVVVYILVVPNALTGVRERIVARGNQEIRVNDLDFLQLGFLLIAVLCSAHLFVIVFTFGLAATKWVPIAGGVIAVLTLMGYFRHGQVSVRLAYSKS